MVCPEVADETNPRKEASPTGRAEVGRGCAISASGSFLAYCSLLVGLTDLHSSAAWAPFVIQTVGIFLVIVTVLRICDILCVFLTFL